MSGLRSMVGWVVRGGDQTRADLAHKTQAIQELQQQVADLRAELEAQRADVLRSRAEASGAISDLGDRTSDLSHRVDRVEALANDHDEAIASLARVVGEPHADDR